MNLIHKFSVHGWIGILFILIFWYLNWNLEGLRTQILFFPLWFGYILTIDAIVFYRKNTSLLTRSKKNFALLFLISAPAWWIFELMNWQTQNWFYEGKQFFTDVEYAILATISFSTVMPAVFETTELVGTFKWINNFKKHKIFTPSKSTINKFLLTGIIMLALVIIFPQYFYYFEWAAVYFILEPINYKLKNRTLFDYTIKGNWSPIAALAIGTLICGFFWEMWNYFSYPKWIYDTPMVNFLHVFEMPLLGYIGYIPFSLELFAIYNFITGFNRKKDSEYIQLVSS
ncbi:MAG: hypothetical protein IH950_08400 [Bacteroidetes bacterium]|nr:hypothetical protein [Bacteroidota bacterium]MCH8033759.1 hypothetical protein [Bacteroidota bacterium]